MTATPRVIGVDPSLTATGLALPDGEVRILKTREQGYLRNADLARKLIAHAQGLAVELVVFEDYAPNARGRLSLIRAAELGGVMRTHLELRAITWAAVPPSELKKWATGNGRAEKDAMVEAAIGRGCRGDCTHDEADAYLARLFALERFFK